MSAAIRWLESALNNYDATMVIISHDRHFLNQVCTHVADLEHRLQERFGTRVDLRYRRGKGALQIHFYTDDDLQRVLEMIGVSLD